MVSDTSVGLAVHCGALPSESQKGKQINHAHFRGTLLLVLLSAGSPCGDKFELTVTTQSP